MSINLNITSEDILSQVRLSQMVPGINEQILLKRIILDEAEQLKVTIEISELQKAADDFRIKHRLTSAKSTEEWLKMNHLSLDDFESIIRFQIIRDRLEEVVSSEQVEKYFYDHQTDYDFVVLYEVVFKDKEIATELYYAIREGEVDFWDVTNRYIEDVDLRRKRGFLGRIRRRDISSELLPVFSISNVPQVVKPIITAKGCHLFWIDELEKAELNAETYKEIQSQIFVDFIREKFIHYGVH
jgi:parvulin-like peptidyl-prolyl isomerase